MANNTDAVYLTQTGGRPATKGIIPGRYALSVGFPNKPAPTGWKWTALSNVARLESGHTPSRRFPEYWNGAIPWIGIKDATDNHGRVIFDTYQHVTQEGIDNSSARILPAGTVCLSRTASVGFVIVMGRPMATSQDFVNWICSDKIDNHFLKYILLSEHDSMLRFASGTTHQTIYYPEAKAFHVCLPDIQEQREIAGLLCALDDKIELNRRMNRTLESIARAVFRQWFVENVDFESWKVGTLGEVAVNIRRSANVADIDPETHYIGLEHMPRGSIALSEWGSASELVSHKFAFKTGDFLFGKLRPYFHKVGIAPIDGVCSTDILVIVPKSPEWYGFVLGHISSVQLINYANAASTGTKMPRTNWSDIANYEVAIPPVEKAEEFTEVFLPMVQQIRTNIMQSRTLASLRDTLLSKLMRGEVRMLTEER